MPVYEYICKECGFKFEMSRHFYDSDEDLACPLCGKKGAGETVFDLQRQVQAAAPASTAAVEARKMTGQFAPQEKCGSLRKIRGLLLFDWQR